MPCTVEANLIKTCPSEKIFKEFGLRIGQGYVPIHKNYHYLCPILIKFGIAWKLSLKITMSYFNRLSVIAILFREKQQKQRESLSSQQTLFLTSSKSLITKIFR